MSEKVKDTNLLNFMICLFKGHKPVSGHFTDGLFYYETKCERCNAVKGTPKIETEKQFK